MSERVYIIGNTDTGVLEFTEGINFLIELAEKNNNHAKFDKTKRGIIIASQNYLDSAKIALHNESSKMDSEEFQKTLSFLMKLEKQMFEDGIQYSYFIYYDKE